MKRRKVVRPMAMRRGWKKRERRMRIKGEGACRCSFIFGGRCVKCVRCGAQVRLCVCRACVRVRGVRSGFRGRRYKEEDEEDDEIGRAHV